MRIDTRNKKRWPLKYIKRIPRCWTFQPISVGRIMSWPKGTHTIRRIEHEKSFNFGRHFAFGLGAGHRAT